MPEPRLLVDMIKIMQYTRVLDDTLYQAQRQGRIPFYITTTGEEAVAVSTAMALQLEDVIYAQYRETGALIQRGLTSKNIIDECLGNSESFAKGKAMPIMLGSRKLNIHPISAPLATQIPHAVGAAYALRLASKPLISVCYFGEGAASEGDFHAGMNFAAVLKCPVLFACRNNQWSISTHYKQQYIGDGIAGRACGYGIDAARVDGNDPIAVFLSTQKARQLILQNEKPFLLEFMTYR